VKLLLFIQSGKLFALEYNHKNYVILNKMTVIASDVLYVWGNYSLTLKERHRERILK
jgi:hypothetical protein